MNRFCIALVLFCIYMELVIGYKYDNTTLDPASKQLFIFKTKHTKPIGLLTTSGGMPVDIRDTVTINTDLFSNDLHFDTITHLNAERIPERVVHANGAGAHGYFEVTHDVSAYTKADVFNGIGKKTQVLGRFSTVVQHIGGSELAREIKALAVKFYTREGNLDLLTLNTPVFFLNDPLYFGIFVHNVRQNPRTNLYDWTMFWDFITLRPETLPGTIILMSDYGIPNGYRKMDIFAIHTFQVINKYGDKHFVKFNFRSEQGIESLTTKQANTISAVDPRAYTRDLYNAIEEKNFPSWILEMDVMSPQDIKHIDYNPFDLVTLWKNGTYHTVPIGRLVFNKNPDNIFRDIEQSAFCPSNLVPGILEPPDFLFKSRRFGYRDAQNYRLGINHFNIEVNKPRYSKTYNRDGVRPVRDNMKDAPNSFPNSFNGPVPYVDYTRPSEKLFVYERNAVDLEESAYIYNVVLKDDPQKVRLAENIAMSLVTVTSPVNKRVIKFLSLASTDLGKRVKKALKRAKATAPPLRLPEYDSIKLSRRV